MSEENRDSGRARQAETTARYLAFQLGGEQYAIPLLQVKEVIEMSEPTPLPKMPSYFKGIINLRGQVISVVDLRLKLELPTVTNGPKTAIIILDLDSQTSLGIVVDRINSVQAFENEDIGAAPDSFGAMSEKCLTGVARRDKKLTLLLNIRAALSLEDIRAARANAQDTKQAA